MNRKRTQLITCNEFNNRDELLEFLWELEQSYNLKEVVIQIVKTTFGYELYWQDWSKETKEDRWV